MLSLQAAASAVLLYFVTKCFYNVYFHPLARYKGPLLWKLFQFRPLLVMLQGNLPYRVKQLHDEYGPVVRVGPNELSFIDDRAWKDIFLKKEFIRPPTWAGKPPGVEADNLITAPVEVHARFRKALSPAFSDKATQEYEKTVRIYVDKLLAHLHGVSKREGRAELVQWFNFATFDIIGELCWGRSFGCLEDTKDHPFMTVLLHFKAALIATFIKHYRALDALMPYITPKSALTMFHNVISTGKQRIRERKASEVDKPDLISYIAKYNDSATPDARLNDEEIEQNALTTIVAGSETLTTALSGTMHYLLSNPSALFTLTREVRMSFPFESEISGNKLAQLPYLNAVLNESLRLCPPLPDSLRRAVPAGGATVASESLPEGVTVSVACWSMFQSPMHFSDPTRFAPERWLGSKEFPRHNKNAFYPFSLGPHGCLGQSLAWLEMRLILALLVWRYDFSVLDGEKVGDWTGQKIYWTWEKKPLWLKMRNVRV